MLWICFLVCVRWYNPSSTWTCNGTILCLRHQLLCITLLDTFKCKSKRKSNGILWQAKLAVRVSGRLRPRIISTFGTTRVVHRQPYAPAAFTPGEIPGTHFQRLSRPQGTWFCQKEPRKKSQVIQQGIDPRTIRLATQCLNHYATPALTFKCSYH
jgi:hypothetical protein